MGFLEDFQKGFQQAKGRASTGQALAVSALVAGVAAAAKALSGASSTPPKKTTKPRQ